MKLVQYMQKKETILKMKMTTQIETKYVKHEPKNNKMLCNNTK